ncbi:hypothetical protein FOD75_11250 (plasmid) [Limosilactobacillus reuteri]|uniref:Rpn family recombination-promoting nuclease/putative transposase n=1 Tax=Limosilactobacillus reuteri TaxID=1598 RepID=A0A517D8H5_LIMRT|nr:PD-(D/E)XK nuclease family transposase [Limosilactobacillus reuteri]QDR73661.1 hypothetical protein FOD75_11250 [Limosilactobacillus reuteri]
MNSKWETLGITNDFIFGAVMQMHDNALHLIQAILPDLNIKSYKFLNTPKDVKVKYDQRGVRFDVFVEDDNGRVYDIEMQVTNQESFGRITNP